MLPFEIILLPENIFALLNLRDSFQWEKKSMCVKIITMLGNKLKNDTTVIRKK